MKSENVNPAVLFLMEKLASLGPDRGLAVAADTLVYMTEAVATLLDKTPDWVLNVILDAFKERGDFEERREAYIKALEERILLAKTEAAAQGENVVLH